MSSMLFFLKPCGPRRKVSGPPSCTCIHNREGRGLNKANLSAAKLNLELLKKISRTCQVSAAAFSSVTT